MTDYGGPLLWALAVVVGVLTYAIRFSFVYLFGRVDEVPAPLRRALRFVPAAVFAALVAPAFLGGGAGAGAVDPDRLLAGGAAAVVAWRTGSVAATIAVGMVLLWTLRFLV